MSKYVVTLEIESERTMEELFKPAWGALLIGELHFVCRR